MPTKASRAPRSSKKTAKLNIRRTPPAERPEIKPASKPRNIKKHRHSSEDSSDEAPSFRGSPSPGSVKRRKIAPSQQPEDVGIASSEPAEVTTDYVDLSNYKEEDAEEEKIVIKTESVQGADDRGFTPLSKDAIPAKAEDESPSAPPKRIIKLNIPSTSLATLTTPRADFEIERKLAHFQAQLHNLQEQIDAQQEIATTAPSATTARTDKLGALEIRLSTFESSTTATVKTLERNLKTVKTEAETQATRQTRLCEQLDSLDHEMASQKAHFRAQIARKDKDTTGLNKKIVVLETRVGNLESELALRPRVGMGTGTGLETSLLRQAQEGAARGVDEAAMQDGPGTTLSGVISATEFEAQLAALQATFKAQHARHDARIYRLEVRPPVQAQEVDSGEED